ncbi:hypothetical protein L950_0203970 [Sphingobacterium sp. IITKGP-BTPF85]|nr:hypothetical protein L950_0203970 [Sphingobacterium sp. IITKGP-BTPF85]
MKKVSVFFANAQIFLRNDEKLKRAFFQNKKALIFFTCLLKK